MEKLSLRDLTEQFKAMNSQLWELNNKVAYQNRVLTWWSVIVLLLFGGPILIMTLINMI